MSYIDPRTVISPKNLVRDLEIVFDAGSREGSWAVATFLWDNKPRVGIRWNGELGQGVGTPQSRGVPTWFVLPEELAEPVLDCVRKIAHGGEAGLIAAYREMASDRQREAEAEEWSEGLIGDASAEG
jgi:hypothetical protein